MLPRQLLPVMTLTSYVIKSYSASEDETVTGICSISYRTWFSEIGSIIPKSLLSIEMTAGHNRMLRNITQPLPDVKK